jgi:hypothetical protein
MCKNHSHLIARFVGEAMSGQAPVLMFKLANSDLQIEGGFPDGAKLIVPTSGMLYLPSWSLDGSFLGPPPAMAVRPMSLFCVPGDVTTIMLAALNGSQTLYARSTITPSGTALSPTHATGPLAEEDVPF